MDLIRPFSIEGSEQDDFEQGFRKMIQDFVQRLPIIKADELAKDSQCMICQNEYGLGNLKNETIEEAVHLPCGHHAGRKCLATWLQPKQGDSCPMCRKRVFQLLPWPHIIGERDWDESKYYFPTFDDICMTIFRSDYTLPNTRPEPRSHSPPGWIVRAAGRYNEDDKSLIGFFRNHDFRRTFARKILSTSPRGADNAAWMLQVYPEPGEVEAHVEALASVLETADPRGVLYIQLRRNGGATIYQVDTWTYSDKPYQDEGIFRNLVLRGALDGPPLINEGRQGSWWAYLGHGDDFSTDVLQVWRETGNQISSFNSSRTSMTLDEVINDPDRDGGDGAEAVAAFGRESDDEGAGVYSVEDDS